MSTRLLQAGLNQVLRGASGSKAYYCCCDVVLEIPSDHAAPSWSYAKRPQSEIACDVFAAELLLPHKLFKPRVDAVDVNLDAIGDLAKEFDASLVATASRFTTFSSELCAFVLSEGGRVATKLHPHGLIFIRKLNSVKYLFASYNYPGSRRVIALNRPKVLRAAPPARHVFL